MSVQGEINRIKDAVSDAYSAVSDKGGEMPATQNVANLAQAVNSIPTGPDDTKMDKTNPTGTGSFSLNRMPGSTVGSYSFAEGVGTTASGTASHAEGDSTTASGSRSHAEGNGTTASGNYSHAEGVGTTASGHNSHAEGVSTIASWSCSHVQGKYNVDDTDGLYADIVGWGTSNARKNISSLTTTGDLHLAGDVYIGANADGTGGTKLEAGSDDVFIAEYGVTTYQEIDAAYNNGKTLLALDGERTYLFAGTSTINGVPYYNFYTFWSSSQVKNIRCYLESDYPNNWYTVYYVANEASSNKKITIDDTTKNSNTYYPTTKAVYDFVNGQKEVFIAKYGVTTYQEILDAYNAGKIVLCRDTNKIYQLNSTYGPAIIFSLCYDDVSFNVQCDPDNIWMRIQWALERRTNKTQIISSSSTTSEYPSAKAVYDYIQSLDAREVSY